MFVQASNFQACNWSVATNLATKVNSRRYIVKPKILWSNMRLLNSIYIHPWIEIYFKAQTSQKLGLFHLVDVLPTLLHLADSSQEKNDQKLDGLDQWSALTGHSRPPRKIMVYNIDDNLVPAVLNGPNMKPQFQIAVRENNFKLIWGQQKMLHR